MLTLLILQTEIPNYFVNNKYLMFMRAIDTFYFNLMFNPFSILDYERMP